MPRAEINAIFGLRIDRKDGSDLLKCLQEHRQQGTLDQKLPYPDALIEKGLKYLRAKYPLDEDAAIIARIDREADRTFRLPQTNIDQSPQAVSQWEILRQENRKKHAEKVEAEEEKAREEMENPKTLAKESPKAARREIVKDGTALVQLRPEPEWIQRYRDKAQMKELPEMSAWARLLPSGLVTIAVVTLAVLFAQFYKQPSRKARLWPDLPPAAATLITLIGANVAVFVLWRLPPLWRTLNRIFLVVPAYPHSLSMLTACFSHQSFSHLLTNLIPLWLIGTRLHDDIGRGPFLALYFSSAVIAAYLPMVVFVMRRFFGTSTLGASGVVTALIGTSCVLHEGQNISLPFLPPDWTRGMDTGVMLAVFMLLEVMSLRKWGIMPAKLLNTSRPHIDNMGHLSGYCVGIGTGALIRSTDPRWKNAERKHFFTKDFGKRKVSPSPD
ncbi:hypothetical protein IMSHALPRED_009567 [Imshaugia aleurites]|uniref:Peptidase S54 rhomboid domain-containing protein n=1 Tax=Imshaugia aleurites TaxID=172621 RepID=A0A8H3G0J4_9LECA|nr:hypothetical protein IMSHALPRED_009567 [Imshaugia aleurites]